MLEMLAGCGVRYLFGNPGTTELPLNDALVDEHRLQYILALQEVPAMAIADGYAMASRSPGVVNVHICCGLGNAMGMLYNAFREGTPLLVTAGQQDQRMSFEEPILWGEMVEVARPWTKWAAEVRRVEDLPSAIRRAVHTAVTPPTGPVFLSLPLDVQTAPAEGLDLTPPQVCERHVRPPVEALRQAADVLAKANNPGVLVGSRICEADAVGELVAVAERPVLALIGDGSAMYGIQGLWTAAHYRLPVTFVICNNREYKILKDCAGVLKLPAARAGRFEGLDVNCPAIDFVALAESLGVSARRVSEPEELSDAASRSLAADAPRLIEVAVRSPEECPTAVTCRNR